MKKVLGTTVVALSGLVLFSGVVLADEVETPKTPFSSDLTIGFEAENPNMSEGPFSNNVSVTSAPAAFNFGQRKADFSNNASYELATPNGAQWAAVNDDRNETNDSVGKGWSFKVQMAPITDTEDATKTINGSLNLTFDAVKEYHMGTELNANGDDIKPADPNKEGVVTDWAEGKAPTNIHLGEKGGLTAKTITVQPNSEAITILAQEGTRTSKNKQGYAAKINSSTISFTDLEKSVIGKTFATKLVWTLTKEI